MFPDTRIVPVTDCREYDGRRDGLCRAHHQGWKFCPQPHLPCMCSSYLGRDGETGRQRWPQLDRKAVTR